MECRSRLTIEDVIRVRGQKTMAICLCSCGNRKLQVLSQVKNGYVLSCGCLKTEAAKANGKSNMIHGGASKRTPEYRSWESMKSRCKNQKDPMFVHYGARGVSVCGRWSTSFEAFLEDMGSRPVGHTLDRIDVNGNYEPGNCRWADSKTQARNKRSNQIVTFQNRQMTLVELSEVTGLPYQRLHERIVERGWETDRAVSEPPRMNRNWRTA